MKVLCLLHFRSCKNEEKDLVFYCKEPWRYNYSTFAKSHSDINNVQLRTIKHCRKSLLVSNNEAWEKKSTDSCFDVTLGSYDVAEICELVVIYTLSKLENITSKDDIGLYRDDGLILLRELNGQQTDKI